MCLAVPACIVELNGADAVIECEGVRRQANVSMVEDVKVGDYVLLHAGFAIQKWSEQDVKQWREIIDEMREMADR